MQENRLFEALLDVIPFSAYAVDIETYEVIYANKMMTESMYNPKAEYCWERIFGQEEVCSWCTIAQLKQRKKTYQNEKIVTSFFDESDDKWFQTYDELMKWPDGRTVKYSIAVDITDQKEIQASMIKTHTKLARQTKKLQEANKKLEVLAKKDYLTQANNRGYFFELVNRIFQREYEKGYTLYVGVISINNYKRINKREHYKIVEDTLKAIARGVEDILCEGDIFGRLMDDYFAFAIIENNIEEIQRVERSIQELLESEEIKKSKFEINMAMEKKIDSDKSIDELLQRADRKLYENRVYNHKIKFRIYND